MTVLDARQRARSLSRGLIPVFVLLAHCGSNTLTLPDDVPWDRSGDATALDVDTGPAVDTPAVPDVPVTPDVTPVDVVPTTDVPVVEDTPVVDIPVADVPVVDVPTVDVPVMDVPVMDVPVMDIPAVDIPPVDVPIVPDIPLPDVPPDVGCPSPQTRCGGTCLNLRTDPHNCGACGLDCNALPYLRAGLATCVNGGACDISRACAVGHADCDGNASNGCETDITTPAHCGSCALVCPSTAPLCSSVSGGYACSSGCAGTTPTRCAGVCVDTATSTTHCGACGRACATPANGTASCAAGACGFTCLPGFHNCGGACVSNTALATCGATCTPCVAPSGATATCDGTACNFVCPASTHRCGSACASNADIASCGTACTPCTAPANATATCNGTSCGAVCNAGFHACGATCLSNTAVASCGAACTPCVPPANATATCNGSACDFTCNAGYMRSGASCVAVVALTPPRPTAPMSGSVVSTSRPSLRWALPPGTDGVQIDICRDRACSTVSLTFSAGGTNVSSPALPSGMIFWRMRSRLGASIGTAYSPTWEFYVPVRSGAAVTSAGSILDVNGDSYADVLVGSSGVGSNLGRARLYQGAPAGVGTLAATRLTGMDGANAYFGNSVSSAGDVNGDGFVDAVVGAYLAASTTGRAYVFHGSAAGLSMTPASTLTGPDGTSGYFGYSVANAGDVNGDGYADVIVGAYLSGSSLGRVHIYYGSASGIPATPGTSLASPAGANGRFGYAVATAGDLNGDNFSDVVIGAPGVSANTGRAFVYYGSSGGIAPTPSVTLNALDGAGGSFGIAVGWAGDVNGDGYSDLAVGAENAVANRGSAYVYHGGPSGIAASPSTSIPGPDGAGGYFGFPVGFAGDVNADGFSDLLVGAQNARGTVGAVHVFRGSAAGVVVGPTLASRYGPDGVAGQFGTGAAGLGDTNGDGFSDICVGAFGTASATGSAYVYNGVATGLTATPVLTLTGPDGPPGAFGISIAMRAPFAPALAARAPWWLSAQRGVF